MSFARVFAPSTRRAVVLLAVVLALWPVARPETQGTTTYALYTESGRRNLPFRTAGNADLVRLDQLAQAFNLSFREDNLVGGLIVQTPGQTILLIPGQSFASIGPGTIVSLPAPVQRDRNDAWEVPVEFIRQALGPALRQPVEIRRASHVVLFGNVHLPRVSGRGEAQGRNHRITIDIQPATPHTVDRSGNQLNIHFDAVALDYSALTGLSPEFVTAARVDGTTLHLTLGPETAGYRVDEPSATRLVIDLAAPAPPPPPPTPVPAPGPTPPARGNPAPGGAAVPAPTGPPPPLDLSPSGTIRTVVIDPGHGGEDAGARGPRATEKDIALQLARQLKAAVESRIGLRVLLTRERDEDVPLDRRASLANNNKADLYISLHANASVRGSVRGAQVLSLSEDDYRSQLASVQRQPIDVPVVGGGMRTLDVVPWDLAQIPDVAQSAAVAAILTRRLAEQGVPLFTGTTSRLPLRTLIGANMPAIMVEVGFLSNAEDAQALAGTDRAQKVVDAILATIADIRRGIRVPTPGPGQ